VVISGFFDFSFVCFRIHVWLAWYVVLFFWIFWACNGVSGAGSSNFSCCGFWVWEGYMFFAWLFKGSMWTMVVV